MNEWDWWSTFKIGDTSLYTYLCEWCEKVMMLEESDAGEAELALFSRGWERIDGETLCASCARKAKVNG
jgi:hypothetical protein